MSESPRVYRVLFNSQGSVYELYARHVSQGELYAFIEIGQLIFGERSGVLVDPSEERLKNEFAGVKRIHVPLHGVIRIDEVERSGVNKIHAPDSKGNVTPFPGSPTVPPSGRGKDKT